MDVFFPYALLCCRFPPSLYGVGSTLLMCYDVVFPCVDVCAHVFGHVTISTCRGANVPSCACVAVPNGAREEMARPLKKK